MSWLEMTKLTLRWAFRKPANSRYPFEPRTPIEGSRGQLLLDKTKCIYCTRCAVKCPTGALVVNRHEKQFAIDRLSCISCGYCVEICAKDSLTLSASHGSPAVSRGSEVQ